MNGKNNCKNLLSAAEKRMNLIRDLCWALLVLVSCSGALKRLHSICWRRWTGCVWRWRSWRWWWCWCRCRCRWIARAKTIYKIYFQSATPSSIVAKYARVALFASPSLDACAREAMYTTSETARASFSCPMLFTYIQHAASRLFTKPLNYVPKVCVWHSGLITVYTSKYINLNETLVVNMREFCIVHGHFCNHH